MHIGVVLKKKKDISGILSIRK